MGDVYIQLFLDLILDKDKYKLSLEFDAILAVLGIYFCFLVICVLQNITWMFN